MQVCRQHTAVGGGPRPLLGLEDECTGPVAEKHAGGPVVPVENAREGLGADHQRGLRLSRLHEVVRRGKRVDEAGTHGLHVETDAAVGAAEFRLHHRGGGRKGLVRCGCGDHDQVDVVGAHARRVERLARRVGREVGRHLAVGGDVALRDPAALADPFVGRVDTLRELGVRDDIPGEVAPDPLDDGTAHAQDAAADATCGRRMSGSSRSILDFSKAFPSYLIMSIATPIAVANPTASVPP